MVANCESNVKHTAPDQRRRLHTTKQSYVISEPTKPWRMLHSNVRPDPKQQAKA